MLVAFNAGRRAALIQGMSERVAIGIGAALAVLGSLMLQGGGLAVAAVAGLILGLALLAYAPAPPLPAAPAARQIVLTYQQIVCVAPLSAVIIALSRAFFP